MTKNTIRKITERAAIILCFLIFSGCVSSHTVKRVGPDYWTRMLTENALTTDHVSERTAAYLSLRGWERKAKYEPEFVLLKVRDQVLRDHDREGLIAFSEIAYLSGHRAKGDVEKAKYFMTAARASYAVLFDREMGPALEPLDPNYRFAADIYNYSLSQLVDILVQEDSESLDKERLPLVEGTVNVTKKHDAVDASSISNTLVAFSHTTDALRLHNRRRGLGVPVVASRPPQVIVKSPDQLHPPVYRTGVNPVSLLIRFDQPWSASGDDLTATSEIWYSLATSHVDVEGLRVPLESDTSLALSLFYDRGAAYRGLLKMPGLLRSESVVENRGLYLLEPYNRNKIPVLLIHGLMDSPLTWVPMLNSLVSDPFLNEHYQFWLFFYPTANPVVEAASELRHSLQSLYEYTAANGEEWQDIVLLGHSMGGLITRLLITSSGDHFSEMERQALADAEGDVKLQEYITGILDFEPLPYVHRAVFLATPHRGAKMASGIGGAVGKSIVKRPDYMKDALDGKDTGVLAERESNSIANLETDSPFTLALNDSTWSTNVTVHSIIGDVRGAGRTNGTDTIVEYWSSHVDGAESELVVKADHLTVHKKTPAIAEVRRILVEHLSKSK